MFDRVVDPGHLDGAARHTLRGKLRRRDVAWFVFRYEEELARLRRELLADAWRPDGFELVRVRDPKPRVIGRSTVADRVVHAALVTAMEPALTTSLRPECYACRPGFGTHRAAIRLLEGMRRHRYALHLDVKAYFPSVDLGILRTLLARRIHDDRFLSVLDRVLAAGEDIYREPGVRRWLKLPEPRPGTGLPVGAWTSQVLASWLYLDALDHLVTRAWGGRGYVRYVDDLFVFGDSIAAVEDVRAKVVDWLAAERRLVLKHPGAPAVSTHGTLNALGYAVRREGIEPLPRARRKLAARALAYVRGDLARGTFERSVASLAGLWMP